MSRKILTLLLLILVLTWLSHPAHAQEPEGPIPTINWQELQTDYFIIVYAESIELEGAPMACPACGAEPAVSYANFVDKIYGDLAKVFKVDLDLPLNLQLFPTEESYYQINPLAEQMEGVFAHAVETRGEIAVALPRLQDLSQERIINNMRHEMTHLFVSFLSDDKLNTGFHEGTAQYLEIPGKETPQKVELLRQAQAQNRLLTWAQTDDPEQFYSDPQVAYPQTLSMVSFLIERYGLPSYLKFLQASAEQPGYRSALEAAYDQSADELEAEWLAYLPEYFYGRWQINAVYAYDLSRVSGLVNKGAYTDAEIELTETIALLQTTNQLDTLAQAEALLNRVHQGQAAGVLADEAYQALKNDNYPETIEKGNAAIAAYQQVGYQERIPEIQIYIFRATKGQEALNQLAYGEDLLNKLNFFQAEREIYAATVLLRDLGNEAAVQQGIDLLHQSAERQRILAYAIIGVGAAILLFNGVRRIYNRLSANPLEVEFT